MPDLKNKTILILSPQRWGNMLLSKHHYAIELAKRNNIIYFLNPPEQSGDQQGNLFDITEQAAYPNLFLINHHLNFPYRMRFRLPGLFHWLMGFHIKRVLKLISRPVDIVWSFDLNNLYPLRLFDNVKLKIFHPVDLPLNPTAIDAARGAHIIFSIATEILDQYGAFQVPRHFIGHGVSEDFLRPASLGYKSNGQIHIGVSGNLLRTDIDRSTLLKIVIENPSLIFDFWGSYKPDQTNIGGGDDEDTRKFIEFLHSCPNVRLHGVISSHDLALAFRKTDAFLICYDVLKDQSRGTNYHKVMEYLSTGKVIISNNITTYNGKPELVQMVEERTNNNHLPDLFARIAQRLPEFNTRELITKRVEYARLNSYTLQLDRIESLIKRLE